MRIGHEEILEKVCKEVIETILMCLDHATKGTVYLVGSMPELRAVRVTSGIRVEGSDEIRWGLPEKSDYNMPGKTWLQYRDEPHRPLEAMAWCVECQKSWTSDNPLEDVRSVRKQLLGEPEDFHHMEPVLLKKSEVYEEPLRPHEYPTTWDGTPIWQHTDHVVVAVIKIHFLPHSIKRGDRSTKLIKQLARRLGSELLSLHLREFFSEARRQLDQMRIESCNALAHDLRNPLMKLGFLSSAINMEIAFLREQWERYLVAQSPELPSKEMVISVLDHVLDEVERAIGDADPLASRIRQLRECQNELKLFFFLPEKSLDKVEHRIVPLWTAMMEDPTPLLTDNQKATVKKQLALLKRAVCYGIDDEIMERVNHIPEMFKKRWRELAYREFSPDNTALLDEILEMLGQAPLDIPHAHHIKKNLFYLKTLVEVVRELEVRVAEIISTLKNARPVVSWLVNVHQRAEGTECR